MSKVYTEDELVGKTSHEIVDIILVQQEQHAESQTLKSDQNIKLARMVDELRDELIGSSKQLESSNATMKDVKEHMDLMDIEINGLAAGVYRREQMLEGLKRIITEFHKNGKGA